MKFIKENSPHIHRNDSLTRMFVDVLIALAPVIIFSYISYGLLAFRNFAVSIFFGVSAEFVFVLIKNRIPYDGSKHTIKEQFQNGVKHYRLTNLLGSLITSIIFALVMPVSTDPGWLIYLALAVGSLFGIIVGKLVFGGTGSNIFNPAGVGMVFAKLCFGSHYTYPTTWFIDTGASAAAGGTPLSVLSENSYEGVNSFLRVFSDLSRYSTFDLLLGRVPGVLGEAFKIAILAGLIYLLVRHAADFRVIVSYLAIFVAMMAIAGIIACVKMPEVSFMKFMGYQLFGGGLLFGMTFMLTDPVTMPINAPGRVIYGLVAGALTAIIRLFGAYPEGVIFSILIANLLSPLIDYPKWGDQKWSRGKIIVIVSICVVSLGVTTLTLLVA